MFRFLWLLAALLVGICHGSSDPVDIDGNALDPLTDADANAIVIIFMAEDCPISNRYVPLLNRLTEKYSGNGVAMWSVYPNPGVTSDTLHKHRKEFSIAMPALIDADQTLVKKLTAEVTPEAFVFVPNDDPEGEARLVYKGRIDNQYLQFGKTRPRPTRSDLEDAIDIVLTGEALELTETRAVGCYIVTPQ